MLAQTLAAPNAPTTLAAVPNTTPAPNPTGTTAAFTWALGTGAAAAATSHELKCIVATTAAPTPVCTTAAAVTDVIAAGLTATATAGTVAGLTPLTDYYCYAIAVNGADRACSNGVAITTMCAARRQLHRPPTPASCAADAPAPPPPRSARAAGKPSAPATATVPLVAGEPTLNSYGWTATWAPSSTIGYAAEEYKVACYKVGENLVSTCQPLATVADQVVTSQTGSPLGPITRATTKVTVGNVAATAFSAGATLAPATTYSCYVVAFSSVASPGTGYWAPVCSIGTDITTPA